LEIRQTYHPTQQGNGETTIESQLGMCLFYKENDWARSNKDTYVTCKEEVNEGTHRQADPLGLLENEKIISRVMRFIGEFVEDSDVQFTKEWYVKDEDDVEVLTYAASAMRIKTENYVRAALARVLNQHMETIKEIMYADQEHFSDILEDMAPIGDDIGLTTGDVSDDDTLNVSANMAEDIDNVDDLSTEDDILEDMAPIGDSF